MVTSLLFLLLLSSGSVLCAARFGKRYEIAVPITAIGFVLVIFLFGILGILEAGFYAVLMLAAALYLLAAATLIRKKSWKDFFRNLLTPGAAVFVIGILAYSVLYRGMLARHWDEFTHWVDVVKVMTIFEDFATNPLADSGHGSYPPGMAVFQYLLQKINLLVKPDAGFVEGYTYIAYQIGAMAVMLPVMRRCSFRKPLTILAYIVAMFVAPLFYFTDLYSNVLIDPFLGILSGSGLACIFLWEKEEKDSFYRAYILMLCAILVLAKDAGLLFAVMLAAAYLFGELSGNQKLLTKRNGYTVFFAAAAVFLPKLLWDLEVQRSGIHVKFGTSLEVQEVLMALKGQGEPYRMKVLQNFAVNIHDWTYPVGNTGLQLSYITLMFLMLLAFTLLYLLYTRKNGNCTPAQTGVLVFSGAQLLIYIVGLLFAYLFKFSQSEALDLASFPRYMCIGYLPAWLMIVFISLEATDRWNPQGKAQVLAWIFVALVLVPTRPLVSFVTRNEVSNAISFRSEYDAVSEAIQDHCKAGDRVFLVSQGSGNFDARVMKYQARPVMILNSSCSIGEPFYEGDSHTRTITPEAWQKELMEQYDYVALLNLNDYFYEHFSVLFEDPQAVQEDCVYRVDRETGTLSLCE